MSTSYQRTARYQIWRNTTVSLTTASLQRTAEAAWSIMSRPGDWRSGWRPVRNHRCSPRAWSGSWRPEPSALHSRPSYASTHAPGPTRTLEDRDPESQTVTLILDATANAAIFAITAHADEREAHVREVEQYRQTFPEGSFGRQNRRAIAAREGRVAARLRAVERAYRMANEHYEAFRPPEASTASRSTEQTTDREIELE